jgi:hypothetical protein
MANRDCESENAKGLRLRGSTGEMSRAGFLKLGGMGLAGAAMSTLLPSITMPDDNSTAYAATEGIAVGAFAPSLPWSFRDIDDFSNLVGRRPAIIHWFQDWAMDFSAEYLDNAVDRGGAPLVTWEPWQFGRGPEQPDYSLKAIIEGKHDPYIHRWAQAAAAWGKVFYLRFAHEMNGDWTSWSPGVNGNTSRQFISAWRRVHGIFKRAGAANVKWVWAPVAHYEGATPYGDVYPGDAYVDWVGLSGYNWGNTRTWSRWQSFAEIFEASYRKVATMTRKPIMIAEVATAESGGDKAVWIRKAFRTEIPDRFPRIRAVVWFNANKENDWRVNSSPSALTAYKKVVASRLCQERLL